MSIGRTRSLRYLIARLLGDFNAACRGHLGRRFARRLAGRATGRLFGRVFK